MEKLAVFGAVTFLLFVTSAVAQTAIEAEAWKFAQAYDQAIVKSDVAFMEKHLDDQFVAMGPNSLIMNKADAVAQARTSAEKNEFRVVELKSTPVKMSSSGDLVVITTNWKVVRQATAIVNAPLQSDFGSTTSVFRKRGDVWQLLSEHVAFDAAKDNGDLGHIGRRGSAFNRALLNRNYLDAEKFLAPTYLRVETDGASWNNARFLADLRGGKLMISSIRTSSVYVNRRENTAVETGLVSTKGTRNGSSFEANTEYTRLWLKTDDLWRIKAEYFAQPSR